MMRVGLITDHPYRASLGYSIRPRELSIHLSNLGCEVQVFSAIDVNSKISDNLTVYGAIPYRARVIGLFHRLGRKAIKNRLIARFLYRRRMLEMLSQRLADSIYDQVRHHPVEILQGEKEICSMAAVILGKRLGIPAVADIHGLLAEEAILSGFIQEGSKEFVETKAFVADVLHESDCVLAVSENLKNYLARSFNITKNKIFIVPNGGRLSSITRAPKSAGRDVIYAGILESWENPSLIIASIPDIVRVHPKARFSIFGSGSLNRGLIKLAARLKVANYLSFNGLVPYDSIAAHLAQYDIALLPSTLDITRRVACPIKLFDYMGVGLPVVTVDGLWWSDLIKQENVGVVAKANPRSFADAVNTLLSDPDKINMMSRNATQLMKTKYNWANIAKELLWVYQNVLSG